MEESGVIGTVDPERVAVYIGSGIGGLNTVSTEIGKLENRGSHRVSPLCVPMVIANMAAGMGMWALFSLLPVLSPNT